MSTRCARQRRGSRRSGYRSGVRSTRRTAGCLAHPTCPAGTTCCSPPCCGEGSARPSASSMTRRRGRWPNGAPVPGAAAATWSSSPSAPASVRGSSPAGGWVRGRANLAGEIGHWRVAGDGPGVYGKRGSLEGWASGAGLPALARHLGLQGFGEGAEALGLRASRGDAGAMWQRATFFGAPARRSAPPWALLVDLLAPETIVLGNLARRLGPVFTEAALAALAQEAARRPRPGLLHRRLRARRGDRRCRRH